MKTNHVVRAWKDQEYRQNLSAAERANLPAHPSGMIELTDAELSGVSGGDIMGPQPKLPPAGGSNNTCPYPRGGCKKV